MEIKLRRKVYSRGIIRIPITLLTHGVVKEGDEVLVVINPSKELLETEKGNMPRVVELETKIKKWSHGQGRTHYFIAIPKRIATYLGLDKHVNKKVRVIIIPKEEEGN